MMPPKYALTDIPQMDFGWTLLHAADDECTAVESVDQESSGSGKHFELPRQLKSAANTIRGADLPLGNSRQLTPRTHMVQQLPRPHG
jgi:hypothetical protein